MLHTVSNEHDKRQGSFMYDALVPPAEQFEKIDQAISFVKEKLDIGNLSGDELAKRIKERTGIDRKQATFSSGYVLLHGTGTANLGDLGETPGGVQFRITETKTITTSGTVKAQAVIAGSTGNVPANTITMFPVTLPGFTSITNPEPMTDGFDAESDEDLLQRYYERIRTPATSANKAHYKNWAKEVTGVGDARVIPLWEGPNTVKVVIIDGDKQPASMAIINDAQTHIDPGKKGLGEGAAPIGAYTTVVSATGVDINVSVTVTLSPGYTQEQVTQNITASLTKRLKEIAFVEAIVSYAKVGAAILDSEGVTDYSNLLVNNGTANVPINYEEVAVVGTVTVNV
ncbi:baseplate J/gp47 family protein [Brevibacillus brevis]|nr:baseplate J/gp47 family protein [Brevibacillus brevis]